jgi:YbbR domain-containing protein
MNDNGVNGQKRIKTSFFDMSDKTKSRKWLLRALSLVSAIMLWMFVAWDGMTLSTSQMSIPLRYQDVPEGYSISSSANEVSIEIEGRVDLLAVMGRNSLRASVSVQDMMPGKYRLPVHLSVPDGVRILSYSPQAVDCELLRIIERTLRPSLVLTDTLPVGISLGSVVISPDEVVVKGPEIEVFSIRRAELRQAAADIRSGDVAELPAILVGDAGEITGLTMEPATFMVSAYLVEQEGETTVPVSINVVGEPAEGLEIGSVTLSPDVVKLRGLHENIVKISELNLKDIDVTGHREDMDIEMPIDLPQGADLAGPGSVNVRIRFRPAMETRTFLGMPVKIEGKGAYDKWRLFPATVGVTVERAINSSDPFDMNQPPFDLYVDVTNIVSMRMVLPVLVKNVPPGMRVVRTEPSQISIEADTPR